MEEFADNLHGRFTTVAGSFKSSQEEREAKATRRVGKFG